MREVFQWSQETLAELAGLNVRTVQRVENAKSASTDTRRALTAAFEIEDIDAFNKPFAIPTEEVLCDRLGCLGHSRLSRQLFLIAKPVDCELSRHSLHCTTTLWRYSTHLTLIREARCRVYAQFKMACQASAPIASNPTEIRPIICLFWLCLSACWRSVSSDC